MTFLIFLLLTSIYLLFKKASKLNRRERNLIKLGFDSKKSRKHTKVYTRELAYSPTEFYMREVKLDTIMILDNKTWNIILKEIVSDVKYYNFCKKDNISLYL